MLIDDCRDIDIPLAEVSLGNVVVDYRLLDLRDANGEGDSRLRLLHVTLMPIFDSNQVLMIDVIANWGENLTPS